jgi:DNA polymerase-3 subunit alpha
MKNVLTLTKDLNDHARKSWLVVGGVIDSTKKKITRSGKPMMFVNIQDTTGSLELLVFPRTYESTKDVWVEGKNVCVVGRTSEEEGDDKLFVEKAYTLPMENVVALGQQLSVNLGETSISQYAPAFLKAENKDSL